MVRVESPVRRGKCRAGFWRGGRGVHRLQRVNRDSMTSEGQSGVVPFELSTLHLWRRRRLLCLFFLFLLGAFRLVVVVETAIVVAVCLVSTETGHMTLVLKQRLQKTTVHPKTLINRSLNMTLYDITIETGI